MKTLETDMKAPVLPRRLRPRKEWFGPDHFVVTILACLMIFVGLAFLLGTALSKLFGH